MLRPGLLGTFEQFGRRYCRTSTSISGQVGGPLRCLQRFPACRDGAASNASLLAGMALPPTLPCLQGWRCLQRFPACRDGAASNASLRAGMADPKAMPAPFRGGLSAWPPPAPNARPPLRWPPPPPPLKTFRPFCMLWWWCVLPLLCSSEAEGRGA